MSTSMGSLSNKLPLMHTNTNNKHADGAGFLPTNINASTIVGVYKSGTALHDLSRGYAHTSENTK